MKYIIIAILLTGCATSEPFQVERTRVTFDRFESHARWPDNQLTAIWKDSRGLEYQEIVHDTLGSRWGVTTSWLMKK